jgi:hypothetical protein
LRRLVLEVEVSSSAGSALSLTVIDEIMLSDT